MFLSFFIKHDDLHKQSKLHESLSDNNEDSFNPI